MPGRHLLVLLLSALQGAPAVAADDDPHAWLERMAQATQKLNYDGTFVYRNGDQIESMRIIHRADASGERERLVSLSGAPREVLRDPTRVTCILPDDETVMVGKSRAPRPLSGATFALVPDIERYYALSLKPGQRVADRATVQVVVEPRDQYRYGYRLWIDREIGLLLRSELVAGQGPPLEQIVYTSLELPETIPDALLEPGISGDGFRHFSSSLLAEARIEPVSQREHGWRVTWLPEGFALTDYATDPIANSKAPVEHLVYSDGLASLSIFIEQAGDGSKRLDGLSNMGAVNAYGRLLESHHVTVVGEVPAETVQAVGDSVAPR